MVSAPEGQKGESSVTACILGSHPSALLLDRQDPQRPPQVSLSVPHPLSALVSTGFPPIPGLEPIVGQEEDDPVAATLAAAQKLATPEDIALADEDEDEVRLRDHDCRGWWGQMEAGR